MNGGNRGPLGSSAEWLQSGTLVNWMRGGGGGGDRGREGEREREREGERGGERERKVGDRESGSENKQGK